MAGDKRRVDSAVLRDLAGATQAKRDRLDTFYNECRSRVDSAPRGWSTGEWEGTRTFMRLELEQLGKERQELVDRARIVDVAAALAVLPNPLSTWRSLLKLFQPASTTPNRPWTAQDQALFERARAIRQSFQDTLHRDPTKAELEKYLIGGMSIAAITAALGNPALIGKVWNAQALTKFFEKYRGQEVADLGGGNVGECVSLAKRWAKEAFGIELGAFNPGPDNSWNTNAGFDLAKWEKIPVGTGSYQVGDLVFFPAAKANGWNGHIGIVASAPDATGHFTIIEQNYTDPDRAGPVQNTRVVDQTTSLGVMRRR